MDTKNPFARAAVEADLSKTGLTNLVAIMVAWAARDNSVSFLYASAAGKVFTTEMRALADARPELSMAQFHLWATDLVRKAVGIISDELDL